jgi:septation ring formation regulator
LVEALKTLGSLEEDEARAREQLEEIKDIMKRSKDKIASYNLPAIPQVFYIQRDEAAVAIKEVQKELDMKPVSIKTLNIRVDTARDLALKVYNTANELVKTAMMVEMAIVYGNRYRPLDRDLDGDLKESEILFNSGEYKKALEKAIKAIDVIEPGIHNKLIDSVR